MVSHIAYEITVIQTTFKTRMLYCCCVAFMPTHTEYVQDEASTSNMLIDFHESLVF